MISHGPVGDVVCVLVIFVLLLRIVCLGDLRLVAADRSSQQDPLVVVAARRLLPQWTPGGSRLVPFHCLLCLCFCGSVRRFTRISCCSSRCFVHLRSVNASLKFGFGVPGALYTSALPGKFVALLNIGDEALAARPRLHLRDLNRFRCCLLQLSCQRRS